MPVFPLVASTMVVRPGSIRPSASAASIIATPIRSLTDPAGLYASSLPITSAPRSSSRRPNRSIGVRPTSSAWFEGIPTRFTAIGQKIVGARDAPRAPRVGRVAHDFEPTCMRCSAFRHRIGKLGGPMPAEAHNTTQATLDRLLVELRMYVDRNFTRATFDTGRVEL